MDAGDRPREQRAGARVEVTEPSVTIAVVTYRSRALLDGFVASLAAGTDGIASWHLVVADNASDDGTAELARALAPDATVIDLGANRGYAAGINAATATVPPRDAVLVLNPDIRLRPGSVARLLAALDEDSVGIAVPRLVDIDGRTAPSLRREPSVLRALGEAVLGGRRSGWVDQLGEVVRDPSRYEVACETAWASGAAMLIATRCLRAVGPWDESYFLYAEETDYALRAADAGFRLRYVPDASAVHIGGEAHTSPELWSLLMANRVRLFSRRHGPAETAVFRAALVLNEALRSAGSRTHRAGLRALLPPLAQPPTR